MTVIPATDDPETAPFWAAAREGRLVVQTCNGRHRFPPRPGIEPTQWTTVSGNGRIWSYIVAHGPTLPAFADRTPFPVAVIQLDEAEDLRMVGNVIAAPGAPLGSLGADDIQIGQRVRVSFEAADNDVVLPFWVPA